ncbi:MAG: YraN family protein [Acetivibrionales bacterium]|jgi:putative endonuclease
MNRKTIGNIGEEHAAKYLISKGYKILASNFRAGKMGEIDIIARDTEYISFIEVKTRTGKGFGLPCEAVDRKKQGNIIRLAHIYLKQNKICNTNIRFDIVEIFLCKQGTELELESINHIKNAFY